MTTRTVRRPGGPILRILAALPALAAAALLASCAGDGTTLDPDGRPLPPARAALGAAAVDLSLIQNTSREISLTVRNDGGLPLGVLGVTSDRPFLVPRFADPITVAGGASAAVAIRVDAPAFTGTLLEGTISIETDDPEEPVLAVRVTLDVTEGPRPEIDVAPGGFVLTVREGDTGVAVLTVSNAGTGVLTVSDVASDVAWMTPRRTSFPIEPAESTELFFDVDPAALTFGPYAASVTIASDDADEGVLVLPVDLWVGPFRPTLTEIQTNVFTPYCTGVCHGTAGAPFDVSLTAGDSWDSLVGVRSGLIWSLFLVEPGNPDDSFLVIKLEQSDPRYVGEPMPLDDPTVDIFDADILQTIRAWISAGAADD